MQTKFYISKSFMQRIEMLCQERGFVNGETIERKIAAAEVYGIVLEEGEVPEGISWQEVAASGKIIREG